MTSMLEQNRVISPVQTSKLSLLLYGGQDRLNSLRRIWRKIESDPQFSKGSRMNMNHSERYVDACRKIKRFQEVAEEENFQSLDQVYDAYMAIDENLPIDVHLSMFIPIMTMHTSPEQKERWLGPAQSLRIIGAYAQTELAHGSNVRGIETTATYDIGTDEFVINTPSLTSAKWWPGGLGHTATHAVVYANLMLKNKNFGPHPFMVQLRSLKDHTQLPRIVLGDLGPKQGYNSMDNGFARFEHVRIPRTDMLMGFAQVSSGGEYTKQDGAEKIAFGIMLDVRARICINSAYVLARALTISIRYSCVRVQGFVDNTGRNPTERAVIEYPTQQRVLMPLLALAYALHFTGQNVKHSYELYTTTKEASLLPELHASSAGLKAYITTHVSEGMELCRKMCGGHGFLVNAGFADLYTSYLPFSTLEGTKEVLQQQMGRFLLKQYVAVLTRNVAPKKEISLAMPPSTSYLLRTLQSTNQKAPGINFASLLQLIEKNPKRISDEEYSLIESSIFNAHEMRATWCVAAAAKVVEKSSKKLKILDKKTSQKKNITGKSSGSLHIGPQTPVIDPLLVASVELCTAAEAHSELLILRSFSKGINSQVRGSTSSSNSNSTNTSSRSSSSSNSGGNSSSSSSSSIKFSTNKTTPLSSPSPHSPSADTEDRDTVHLGDEESHALRLLFVLLGVRMISRSSGQFLASGAVRIADCPAIGEIEGLLCQYVRTDSLALVEAWQFSDQRLDSTLGRADGNVYEALYEAALKEPLNRYAVSEGYNKYLKHVINRPPRPAWGAGTGVSMGTGAGAGQTKGGLGIKRHLSRL